MFPAGLSEDALAAAALKAVSRLRVSRVALVSGSASFSKLFNLEARKMGVIVPYLMDITSQQPPAILGKAIANFIRMYAVSIGIVCRFPGKFVARKILVR